MWVWFKCSEVSLHWRCLCCASCIALFLRVYFYVNRNASELNGICQIIPTGSGEIIPFLFPNPSGSDPMRCCRSHNPIILTDMSWQFQFDLKCFHDWIYRPFLCFFCFLKLIIKKQQELSHFLLEVLLHLIKPVTQSVSFFLIQNQKHFLHDLFCL